MDGRAKSQHFEEIPLHPLRFSRDRKQPPVSLPPTPAFTAGGEQPTCRCEASEEYSVLGHMSDTDPGNPYVIEST